MGTGRKVTGSKFVNEKNMEEEIFAAEGFHMDSPELHRIVKNVRTSR